MRDKFFRIIFRGQNYLRPSLNFPVNSQRNSLSPSRIVMRLFSSESDSRDKQWTDENAKNNHQTQLRIKNLVFKGGGPKGLAYTGVVEALEARWGKRLPTVERVVGTSAGAITAGLLAVGYTSDEVKKTITPQVMLSFITDELTDVQKAIIGSQLANADTSHFPKLTGSFQFITQLILHPGEVLGIFWRYYNLRGLSGGKEFSKWFNALLRDRVVEVLLLQEFGNKNNTPEYFLRKEKLEKEYAYLTFEQLNKLIEQQKNWENFHGFKHLYIVGAQHAGVPGKAMHRISTSEKMERDDNGEVEYIPGLTIESCTRESMSIPFVYTESKRRYFKNGSDIESDAAVGLDGGILQNYPYRVFDRECYLTYPDPDKKRSDEVKNHETFGFELYEKEDSSFLAWFRNTYDIVRSSFQKKATSRPEKKPHYAERRLPSQLEKANELPRHIKVDNRGVKLISFNISKDKIEELIQSGKSAVDAYFLEDAEKLNTYQKKSDTKNRKKFESRGFNLPKINPYFIQRKLLLFQFEKELAELSEKNTVVSPIVILQGLGGSGKTQFANNFAHEKGNRYKRVFWFDATSNATLELGYLALAKELGVKEETNLEITQAVKKFLQANPDVSYLLIYDNASDYTAIKDFLPHVGSHIIVTTRYRKNWPHEVTPVGAFTKQESKSYIQHVLFSKDPDEEIEKFSGLLGNLPLALAQACAYIKMQKRIYNDYDIGTYAREYKERKENLKKLTHKDNISPDHEHDSVYITWDMTLDKIKAESLLALLFLNFCTFLQGNSIPYFVFEKVAQKRSQNFKDENWNKALGLLADYGMMSLDAKNRIISVHNVVQEVTYLKFTEKEKEKFLKATQELLIESYPYGEGKDKIEHLAQKRILLPHLEVFLKKIDVWMEQLKELDKKEKAILNFLNLSFLLSDAFKVCGYALKQKKLLEHALPILEKHHGPNHFKVARTLRDLGGAYGALGDARKRKELLSRSLLILEKQYGQNHFEVAWVLRDLGSTYAALGEAQKSKEVVEQALIILENHYGHDHPEVAKTLSNLGNAYGALGNARKKKELLERALPILEKHYGPDHPQVARTLRYFGNAYGALGNAQKKKELLERTLPILEEHYGKDHFEVARILRSLGHAYGALGNARKKKELLERGLPILEEHYGHDHPEVARTLRHLGNAYGALGDVRKKKELMERTLLILEKHFNASYFEIAWALNDLGNAYGVLGDAQKSRELLERALVIQEKHYGGDHHQVAIILVDLGGFYGALGATEKSEELLERALVIQEKHFGKDHPVIARTLVLLGAIQEGALRDAQKSRELLERALVIQEKHFGKDHIVVAMTLVNLGRVYGTLGDAHKKKELLERALVIVEKDFGKNDVAIVWLLSDLGDAYGALGHDREEKKLLEKAYRIALNQRDRGADHPLTNSINSILKKLEEKILRSKGPALGTMSLFGKSFENNKIPENLSEEKSEENLPSKHQ